MVRRGVEETGFWVLLCLFSGGLVQYGVRVWLLDFVSCHLGRLGSLYVDLISEKIGLRVGDFAA